jgi:nucleoside-diphosphate-sugar epimerase
VRLPTPIARGTLRAVKAITRALTGGKMSVVSSASLAWLTRDNPFTSERARAELGWAPSVRPEIGVPEAFRWWREHRSPANS